MCRIPLVAALIAAIPLFAQNHWNSRFVSPDGPIAPGKAMPVKGAPYSAQAVSEITDIHGVTHRAISRLYRDREGRERCEETSDGSFKAIFLSDPVEDASYVLDLAQKTARRSTGQDEITWDIHGATVRFTPGPEASTPVARGVSYLGSGIIREDLGTRTIEGIEVTGTRTRSENQVNERWFSPELHMTLEMTDTGSIRGTATYRISNVLRADPPRELFQVPADYHVYSSYGVRMLEITGRRK
jgi:hypothetical protein